MPLNKNDVLNMLERDYPELFNDEEKTNALKKKMELLSTKSGLTNFFSKSKVSSFFQRNGHEPTESILIDYDARSYVRIMKMFYQDDETTINFREQIGEDGISLNDEINKNFHLRYYLPKDIIGSIGKKSTRVIIMFNGLNEMKGFHLYDLLGEYFAENGYAAILLPTAMHLNRRIHGDFDIVKEKEVIFPTTRAINANEYLFFVSFLKSYVELKSLVSLIKGRSRDSDIQKHHRFYEHFFDGEATEISLLGYSLGGLKTLGYFMNHFKSFPDIDEAAMNKEVPPSKEEDIEKWLKETNQDFRCCITVSSGSNLSDVDSEELGIDFDTWQKLLQSLDFFVANKNEEYLTKIPGGVDVNELAHTFRFLYSSAGKKNLGGKIDDKERLKVKGIIKNYLAISGGLDTIVSHKQIQEISPKRKIFKKSLTGSDIKEDMQSMWINQLIVAEGDHHPSLDKSEWHEVLKRVENIILDFINSCGERHFKRSDIHLRLAYLLKYANLDEATISEMKQDFTDAHIRYILSRFDTMPEYKDSFLMFYFRSKAFDPHFTEVIKGIFR